MENTAQNEIVYLDDVRDKATKELHQKVGEHVNKSGFPEVGHLDPNHDSDLENIQKQGAEFIHDTLRDVFRVGEQSLEGTKHIDATKSEGFLDTATEYKGKKLEEEKNEELKEALSKKAA